MAQVVQQRFLDSMWVDAFTARCIIMPSTAIILFTHHGLFGLPRLVFCIRPESYMMLEALGRFIGVVDAIWRYLRCCGYYQFSDSMVLLGRLPMRFVAVDPVIVLSPQPTLGELSAPFP
ncbi:hypothetical protein EDD16DRAFT_1716098 [Pisolithus croceorrhizus]|nr:hypothetical protein EDD16DRAFT_1716098 [Pisolithus croceorrhizus]KAI6113145.1 hypothetical protein EV401DRAFT_2074677 [Pisolithus croceorrhizus]